MDVRHSCSERNSLSTLCPLLSRRRLRAEAVRKARSIFAYQESVSPIAVSDSAIINVDSLSLPWLMVLSLPSASEAIFNFSANAVS